MADKFQVVLDLVDNASGSIDLVKNKLVDLASNASGLAKGFGIAGVGIAASVGIAVGALAAMNNAATVAVTRINELGDASARLGIGVEALDVLVSTFRTFGRTSEQSIDALTDFTEKLEDARDGSGGLYESLQKLNISIKNQDGTLKNNIQLFDEWFTAVVRLQDASQRMWHGAQVNDQMRDIVAQVGRVSGAYDRNRQRVEELTRVNGAMALAAAEARVEQELFNMEQERTRDEMAALMGPASRLWDALVEKINGAKNAVLSLGATIASIFEDYTPAEQFAILTTEIEKAEKALDASQASWAKEQERLTSLSTDQTQLDLDLWRGQLVVDADVKRLQDLKNELKELTELYPELATQIKEIETTQSGETKETQTADQLKAQVAYLARLKKAEEDLRAASIKGFAEQERAKLALTNQRLDEELAEQISSNLIRDEKETEARARVNAIKLANSIATEDRIAKYKEELSKKEETRNLAVQAVISGIQRQTAQLQAQTQTLQTNSRELEYQLELETALERAKQANNNKELDETTIERIKSELLKKRAADLKLIAEQQKKNIEDSVTAIKNETEGFGAITREQRNQLEIKQALIDKERELQRVLTKTERETITNALVDKQKAEQTDQLAKQNAREIEQIYTNAAQNIQGAFSDFFFDVMQGNLSNLADTFKRTIDRMVAELLAANLFKMVGGIGTGTAGEANLSGFFASIFGGISGRATGGPVTAGTPYWVGEEGPEIVIPSASSTVVPTDLSMAVASGQQGGNGGGQQITNITIKAMDAKSVVQLIEDNDRAIVTKLAEASQRYGM